MKKIILIIILLSLLTSCKTHKENLEKIQQCKELGYTYYLNQFNDILCDIKIKEKINKYDICITDYLSSIKNKYNNPDYVNNLKEDDYSKVVRTCYELFGEDIKK